MSLWNIHGILLDWRAWNPIGFVFQALQSDPRQGGGFKMSDCLNLGSNIPCLSGSMVGIYANACFLIFSYFYTLSFLRWRAGAWLLKFPVAIYCISLKQHFPALLLIEIEAASLKGCIIFFFSSNSLSPPSIPSRSATVANVTKLMPLVHLWEMFFYDHWSLIWSLSWYRNCDEIKLQMQPN